MSRPKSAPGRNFTDRQRVKRKAERLAAKISNLPEYERCEVLNAALAAHEKPGKSDPRSRVAVLFVQVDSVYKRMPNVDAWDAKRNALNWPGAASVVAHPPCRLWSRMRSFSTAAPAEKELAIWAIAKVREFGGVLEHPAGSALWDHAGLPVPGSSDAWGFTLKVNQSWWGHKARKSTWLYIVGMDYADIPEFWATLAPPTHVCCNGGSVEKKRPELSPKARSATPPRFAAWLVEVARRSSPPRGMA